jgi:hypothetical protein
MTIFSHHLYEYRKGLRNLILHTMPACHRERIEAWLAQARIAYQIYSLPNGNINVFFGDEECIEVILAIGKTRLKDYTPEQDFILGTMLGYDRRIQCRRYLGLASRNGERSRDEAGLVG